MNIASLQQFIVLIPTCVETDALEKIGQLFQQSACDQIAVLNQERVPLGLLSFRQFILQMTGQLSVGQNGAGSSNLGLNTQESAHLLSPLLEPLPGLPAHWGVEELQPYLHQLERHNWALVDTEKRFVGLLDRLRLLQFLAMQSTVATSAQKVKTGKRSSPSRKRLAELPDPGNMASSTTAVDPLIDLLERMPIPLMLQTSTGRVITQNLAWRQQVGELRDPAQVRREAAVILEATQWGETGAPETQCFPEQHALVDTDPSGRSGKSHSHLSNLPWHDSATSLADTARHPGSCHLGTDPNSCVCICPMKNGQERVWKFLKVPMGTAPTNLVQPVGMAAAGLSTAVAESSSSFKLATLGFNPDPTWHSLSQTEFLWLVLAQDMTEQHQIARELAAKNADLVQLNRLKDEFLSCISHELKTPLTAVLGLSSLLKDHMLGDLNERQSRYAHLIYQSGRHLILIVNDILDLTRIETGQLDLTLDSVEIRAACLEAYRQAQQSHVRDGATATEPEQAPMQFSLDIQPELTAIVADETRLRQMLTNLLSNALKFTETGGAIGLKVEEWEGWVAFTVWDTGIGIPADKQHLIFQKFQQLENPLTRQFEGTGLGLVLTQRLARLHGGDVTFTSSESQGSQFTLLLPPSPPQALPNFKPEVVKPIRAPSITAGNRLALVVEAMPQQIDALSRQLMQLGYRVAIARSGTEALEKSRRLQPGVIFLNPSLPMLSGWDVLTLLKADEATRNLPVVVTATRVDREQACQTGANSFLSLPIQPEPLQRCLARLMEQTQDVTKDRCPNLTVLHLHGSFFTASEGSGVNPSQEAHRLLHPYQCRVLEVDDLEQADLLARVWKPNVILMDGIFSDPFAYLKQLSQYSTLASLPLVTLTVEITHAANLVPGLMVFPCLAMSASQPNSQALEQMNADRATPESSALWQVIQIAVGIHWTPHILIADLSVLESNWAATTPADLCQNLQFVPGLTSLNGVQAAVHYLQIAGFRCSMGQSWQEVVQQLDHHSVDVLLFCVHAHVSLHLFLEISQTLEQLEAKPPILVWNCTPKSAEADSISNQNSQTNLQTIWGAITPQILPYNVSMSDLLNQINQVLSDR